MPLPPIETVAPLTLNDPTAAPTAPQTTVLPLPLDGPGSLAFWRGEISAARDELKKELPDWRRNLQRYKGQKTTAYGFSIEDTTQVNVDYEKTEQKKASLAFKVPEVVLTAKQPQSAPAVPVFQAVLNAELAQDATDVISAMDECLTDVVCPSGIAWAKVGYTGTVVPSDVPGLPPVVQQGQYYIDRGSPAKLLVPSGFLRSNYDKADWLGFRSFCDELELRALSDVQPIGTDAGSKYDEDLLCDPSQHVGRPGHGVTEIWYWASRIDGTVTDRRIVRHLILVDGEDGPRVHEDSPYQRLDPTTHEMIGVEGLPIKVLTLRYTPDSHFPKSDCQMSRPSVDELSATRTIQMQQKRRALPMRGIDKSRLTDPATIQKIEQGEVQSIILTDGNPDEIIKMIALPTLPRDTAIASDLITRDIDQLWAMGQNQSGVTEQGSKTATELTYMQQATSIRLDKERDKVIRWFTSIVAALGGLIQLFADDLAYVEVAGVDGAKAMQAWNRHTVAGKFVYGIKPDSAKRLDQNAERKMVLDRYQLTANDPFNNRLESLRDVFASFGEDPSRHLQQPPAPPVEKPRISLSFKAEDLTNPMVLSLLQQSGFQIDPAAVKTEIALKTGHPELLLQAANPMPDAPIPPMPGVPLTQHGGSAQLQAPLNQHALRSQSPGGHR